MRRKGIKGRAQAVLALALLLALTACRLKDTKGMDPSVQEPEALEERALEEETELSTFLPDYTSAPLLSTTAIRDLSMEVGASPEELRFNWLSPSGSKGRIIWRNTETGECREFTAQCTPSSIAEGYYVNKASVNGIEPGTAYTYQAGNDEAWSPEYSYQSPENTENGLTFLVTSDAQIGQSEAELPEQTAERWDSVLTRLSDRVPEAQFLFHLGDQVANFYSLEQYDMFLEHLALYRIPLAPVVGNHDVANEYSSDQSGRSGGRYFYEHFNVPNRSEVGRTQYDLDGNYYFVRGNALFIVLNSNIAPPYDILEQYVANVVRENPNVRWRIVAQHYTPYSSKPDSTNSSKISEYLARLAVDNHIDLVLAGHDHIYSRSAIINRFCETLNDYDYEPGDTAVNPQGTLYLTCGTSSGCLYHPVVPEVRLVFQNEVYAPIGIRIDLTDTELHLRTYLVDTWTMCDEYTIRKE